MRKPLVLAALVAGSLSFGAFGATADTLPGGVEGCIVTSPGTPTPPVNPTGAQLYTNTCSYVATRTGGFVGGGQSWTVTVYNNNSPTKVVVLQQSGSGPACNIASTQPGNLVVVSVSNGIIAAGNPFPSATDGTIPSNGDQCP